MNKAYVVEKMEDNEDFFDIDKVFTDVDSMLSYIESEQAKRNVMFRTSECEIR